MDNKAKIRFEKLREKRRGAKVFSIKFLDNLLTAPFICFAPWSEYQTMEDKYNRLFKRYQRETGRWQTPEDNS